MHSMEKCIIITVIISGEQRLGDISACGAGLTLAVWLQSPHFNHQRHRPLIRALILSCFALRNPAWITHTSLCASPLQSLFINFKPESLGFSLPGLESTQFTGWRVRCWVTLFTGLLRFREILPQETTQCERDTTSCPFSPSVHTFIWLGCGPTIHCKQPPICTRFFSLNSEK